jgi:hypothetical protein
MRRRDFLLRAAGAAAGLILAREAGAQAQVDSLAAPTPGRRNRQRHSHVVTLAVAGDTTLGYNLQTHVDDMLTGGVLREYVWPIYPSGVRYVLDGADLALVNLECPFTERGEKLTKNFNFRARPELVKILQNASVDVVTLANNHLMDYGPDGLKDTIDTLDAAGIQWFGAGPREKVARRPLVLKRNGVKIGFIGYYFQAPPDMLEPAAMYAHSKRPGVAGCFEDLECMKRVVHEDVRKLARRWTRRSPTSTGARRDRTRCATTRSSWRTSAWTSARAPCSEHTRTACRGSRSTGELRSSTRSGTSCSAATRIPRTSSR